MGITTFAMIAPILPHAGRLVAQLKGKVDYVLIDRMNYHYADKVYKKHGLQHAFSPNFFTQKRIELDEGFEKEGIPCQVLF